VPKFIDRTGQRFGRLTVVRRVAERTKTPQWECLCDCGNTAIVTGCNLGRGTNSCGCLHKEQLRVRASTHGQSKSLTYERWCSMKARCKSDPHYTNVRICATWSTFESFLADMGECPQDHSLERVDNAKGYGPTNCKWIPKAAQPKNTSRCRRITLNGRTMILSDWCRTQGLSDSVVRHRLKRGWSIEEALGVTLRTPHPLWERRPMCQVQVQELETQTQSV
jgi:hypothetical protein